MTKSRVAVFGSINIDLAVTVSHLPTRGETLTGKSFNICAGGKGANQAVALARLSIDTIFIGRVGNDQFGKQLIDTLFQNRVNVDFVQIDSQQPTGTAIITVEDTGENQIIIVGGANNSIDDSDLANLESILPECQYLLLQLEIPLVIVEKAIALSNKYGVKVILDPAPALDLPSDVYSRINVITPNMIEASQLVSFPVTNLEEVKQASNWFLKQGVETVIITMGEKGVFCATHQEQFQVMSPTVKVIDTVGAGDAFNGGLVTGLMENQTLKTAVEWGVIAGSLAVTKSGSQSSFPTRKEFNRAL